MTINNNVADVLIVGAGLSGLTAAYYLTQAGRAVVLLEARERVGGRIFGVQAVESDHTFDLGPAWFWPQQQHIQAMLRTFGLTYFEQYERGYTMFERQRGATPERFMPNWQQPPSFRIAGGTTALLMALLERIDKDALHLQQVVTSITLREDGKVDVQVAGGISWLANEVIVTLPPHLAATTIDYAPPLPQSVQMAMVQTPTWMGEAMKVSLVYKRPFWREANLSGMALSYGGPVQQFHDATPADEGVGALFGWVGNHSFGRRLSREERKTAVVAQAVRLFGPEAAEVLDYGEINWEQERFTTNAESNSRVLANEHPAYGAPTLQTPQMDGRLWWATTEVSPVEGGYLDGAIYIGQRVAAAIVTKGQATT